MIFLLQLPGDFTEENHANWPIHQPGCPFIESYLSMSQFIVHTTEKPGSPPVALWSITFKFSDKVHYCIQVKYLNSSNDSEGLKNFKIKN